MPMDGLSAAPEASRWRRALGMCSPVDLLGRHVLARAAEGGGSGPPRGVGDPKRRPVELVARLR